MITVSVVYPQYAGARFDFDYYLQRHIPLVRQLVGSALRAVTVEKGLSGAESGSEPGYIAAARLTFDSVESFQKAFGPHAARIMGDVANYTDIQPEIQYNETLLQEAHQPVVSGWYADAQ
ncbi:EthD family reductase [Chromobacterium sp. IIBBL 290-4]|uniref:EthD family reductase n=1 Tax=Chromobacterium sp. IIBBL 290-4 TaxID=2953890 RepID=UPI0020B7C54B|nr:EthD family reductase [Chromobacterium sp. IIBBL 290-4]UTH75916.1 EthD family reductase [Chromobacterium sp. IIBBL 290-4]